MERKKTPLTSTFLGFVKRGICPVCGAPISVRLHVSNMLLCPNCGDYLEVVEKELRQMDPMLVMSEYSLSEFEARMEGGMEGGNWAFAAPTSWAYMQNPYFRHFDRERLEGALVLDAKWPTGCCVCGKTATREETISEWIRFALPVFDQRDKEAIIVAKGVPYCAEHGDGAQFDTATFSTPELERVVGLFFRSYAYQIQFRKLNPWEWRE